MGPGGLGAQSMEDQRAARAPVTRLTAEVTEPNELALSVAVAPRSAIGVCPLGEDADCFTMASVLRLSATIKALDIAKTCAKSCRVPAGHSLVLHQDGTYTIPGGLQMSCANSQVTFPIGSGRVEPRRRGRKLSLIPDNAAAVDDAVRACLGRTKTPFSFWVRPSRDGSTIRGKATMRGQESVGIGLATLSIKLKQKGVPLGAPEPPTIGRRLPECGPVVELRCRLVL
jgi:hypothetical protein